MFTLIDNRSGEVLSKVRGVRRLVSELAYYQRSRKPDVGLPACVSIFRADEYETHPNWKIDIASCVIKRYAQETATGCPYLPRVGTTNVDMPLPSLYPLGAALWGYAIHLYGTHELRWRMDMLGNVSPLVAITMYCDDVGLLLEEG